MDPDGRTAGSPKSPHHRLAQALVAAPQFPSHLLLRGRNQHRQPPPTGRPFSHLRYTAPVSAAQPSGHRRGCFLSLNRTVHPVTGHNGKSIVNRVEIHHVQLADGADGTHGGPEPIVTGSSKDTDALRPSAADQATQAGPATVIIGVTVQPKPPCPITNRRSSMTTAKPTENTTLPPDGFRFPDPPEHQPDDMTSFNHLTSTGSAHYLLEHFGNLETTLVAGEHYVSCEPVRSPAGLHYPDLLVAFGVDPEVYYRRDAYVISEQGKPPDFVLEIASMSTGQVDIHEKRDDYAELGIPEYWRFDERGEFHGAKLAGDQLVDNVYVPVTIEKRPDGNLHIRWEQGQLAWYDPATGRPILTYEDQHDRADAEREARVRAEARVHELEAELSQLQNP